jgi:DNA-binding transcriptional LysR family regulator
MCRRGQCSDDEEGIKSHEYIDFGTAQLNLSERIGRRLKLQDLHVLMTVVQAGSMGKGAQRLNTTQPAVSRTIADLEHVLGVRLLDRRLHGIEPTSYGRALLHCAAAVFDDLRQGVKNIEFLSDPTLGEITVGGNEAVIAGLVSTVVERLRRRYPGITTHMTHVATLADQCRDLRERKIDLVLGRVASSADSDIDSRTLCQDRMFVVAGPRNRWGTRRKIELAELVHEPWGLPSSGTFSGSLVREAFRAQNISLRSAATGSPHFLLSLLPTGPFLVTIPESVLRFGTNLPPFKILAVELSAPPWSVGVMILKNRTMSPVAQLFVDCAHEVLQQLRGSSAATEAPTGCERPGRKTKIHRVRDSQPAQGDSADADIT